MAVSDRTGCVSYEPDASMLFEAGLVRTEQLIPGRIDQWQGAGGLFVFAAFDAKDYTWRFRGKRKGEVGPVFDRAEPLLAWLKIEGWMDG